MHRYLRHPVTALVGLCLLVASRWLLEGGDAATGSTLWSEVVGCLFAAGIFELVGARVSKTRLAASEARDKLEFPLRTTGWTLVVLAPELGGCMAGRPLPPSAVTIALALSPVACAVFMGVFGMELQDDLPGRLWPGLAALTGLLLLLPQPAFGSVRPWLGLALTPVLLAAGGCATFRAGAGQPWRALSTGSLLAALFFAARAVGVQQEWTPAQLAGAGLDGLSFLLTAYVLRTLGPARWSSQFLLIPLLSLLEGVLVLKPILDWRSWLGLGLLGLGGMRQVLISPAEDERSISLHASQPAVRAK